MRGTKKKVRKVLWIIAAALLCAALALLCAVLYGKYQLSKVPGLTFQEALAYTTKNNPDAVITVGTIKDGAASYRVYGENGRELPAELHTYEIGSLTKTFTAALISRAVLEGRISLGSAIDQYLPLPDGAYPTIRQLLTHTGGYKGYYFESPMISNFFGGRNDFYGITKEMVLEQAGALPVEGDGCGFTYSNFGYAVLGLVLESVYGTDCGALLNRFAQDELGLADTKISDQSGDLGRYWDWNADDAYLPAGALTSNIADMLSYARMQLEGGPYFSQCHRSLREIDASTPEASAWTGSAWPGSLTRRTA